jgi:hypothetical protein
MFATIKARTLRAATLLSVMGLLAMTAQGQGGGPAGGGGGGKPGGDPPPCDGSPIQVLVENLCGASMWIDVTDGDTACAIICQLTTKKKGKKPSCPLFITWIGGIVVADQADEHGFHFDPDTVIVAEVTAEGMQTNICQIAANPVFYDGGLWFIPPGLVEYQPLQALSQTPPPGLWGLVAAFNSASAVGGPLGLVVRLVLAAELARRLEPLGR